MIISQRITNRAEEYRLLPEGQMGNRRGILTELAVWMVVEAARAAWERDAVASLLQLDIKGAYDRVNYTRLLNTLRK